MTIIKPVDLVPISELGKVHFIGIGGSGMSGIAEIYSDLGVEVTGSDRSDSVTLQEVAKTGIPIVIGQKAENIGDADTVIYSTAIRETNEERAEAVRRGLRVWHRSAALAALMLDRRVLSVTGTHGKTTTSAMATKMFIDAGGDPTYVIGSTLNDTGIRAKLGSSDLMVIEADESDGSFLQYPSEVAIITNVVADHLANWGTAKEYAEGMYDFASVPSMKTVILNSDDEGALKLANRLRAEGKLKVITYGFADGSDYQLTDMVLESAKSVATLEFDGGEVKLELQIPGKYNLLNAAAAYIAGLEFGLPAEGLLRGAANFSGTLRRFQLIADVDGVRIYDDYAHLPNEIRALHGIGRLVVGDGRLVAVHQPFLYSRTVDFLEEFGETLAEFDLAVVTDILGAREDPVPGITGQLVVDSIKDHGGEVIYVPDKLDLPEELAKIARPKDLIVTFGVGDVYLAGPPLAEILRTRGVSGN